MIGDYQVGAFRGRKLIQRRGNIGGARSVFVKLQGNKNELIYPTFGGIIKNPFKGAAKMFAGDLCEYRPDANGLNPEIYILKTYKVAKTTSTSATVTVERNKYAHKPFVGDKIGKAPNAIGGSMTALNVIGVKEAIEDSKDVWELTLSGTASFTANDILVEADGTNKMMVKAINGVMDADIDMLDAPATGDEDFDGARYMYTPALGGVMYTNKMSPMPDCVAKLNQSNINGWFKIQF